MVSNDFLRTYICELACLGELRVYDNVCAGYFAQHEWKYNI